MAPFPSGIARQAAPRLCSSFWGNATRHSLQTFLPPPVPLRAAGTRQRSRSLAVVAEKKLWYEGNKFIEAALMNKRISSTGEILEEEKKNRPAVQPGEVSPKLAVPDDIPRPPYVNNPELPDPYKDFQIQDAEGIAGMRNAGRLAAKVLNFAGSLVKPGVTTDAIDQAVHKMIIDAGAYPSLLDLGSFPKSISTGINEIMCFGTPDSRALEDGDIISIHISVYLNGYHANTSRTFLCGAVDEALVRMCQATLEALEKAIQICGPGVELRRIGKLINEVADRNGLGVVWHYHGHGIGKFLKSEPNVRHYRNDEPGRMFVGQTLTLKPILSTGCISGVLWQTDKRTVHTLDRSPCALFEHTVLITSRGVEVLTL